MSTRRHFFAPTPRAVVPYGKRTLVALQRRSYLARGGAAGIAASYALPAMYNSRWTRNQWAMAGRIGRMGKNWIRRRIGRKQRQAYRIRKHTERIGSGNSKRIRTNAETTGSIATRTFNFRPLIEITHGENNGLANRERNMVNLRGVKICWSCRNKTSNPLQVNWALVIPKEFKNSSVTSDFTSSWYRDPGSSNIDRSLQFDAARTALEHHCLPINTDKFEVIAHKRFTIMGLGTATEFDSRNGINWKNIHYYQKINRQVRFDRQNEAQPSNMQMYMVWWCDQPFSPSLASVVSNAMEVQNYTICYYKEPKQ